MRWTVHGERLVYESPWMSMLLADVEVPGGRRFEHHLVRLPRPAASAVVHDPDRGILLLWRHRFITDRWGWEIPAGAVDSGETPEQAAARETLEETGWQPGPLRPLLTFNPANGAVDQLFYVFAAEGAEQAGEPADPSEAERIEWLPLERVREVIQAGEIPDGNSALALLWFLQFEQSAQ